MTIRPATAAIRRGAALAGLLVLAATQPFAQPAAPPDQFFDSNGVRIRYVEQGSGPAIVLMHGYTGTLDHHFVANGVFADLAKDHRVIAFDLRGHGKSGKPHDPGAYGEAMAGDVVRLLDSLKIERAHVIGYSLGALIAGRLATMHPNRLISVASAINMVGNALASGDSVYETDDDLDLVVAALPFGLKLTESLLAQSPEHPASSSWAISGPVDAVANDKPVRSSFAQGVR